MTNNMKSLPRCRFSDVNYTFRGPLLKYLKKLVLLTTVYDTERYFFDKAGMKIAIEGNVMVLCNFLSTANELFVKQGISFDRALLEHKRTGNKNSLGRLWFFFKPESSDNRMVLDVEQMKYKNIELY